MCTHHTLDVALSPFWSLKPPEKAGTSIIFTSEVKKMYPELRKQIQVLQESSQLEVDTKAVVSTLDNGCTYEHLGEDPVLVSSAASRTALQWSQPNEALATGCSQAVLFKPQGVREDIHGNLLGLTPQQSHSHSGPTQESGVAVRDG